MAVNEDELSECYKKEVEKQFVEAENVGYPLKRCLNTTMRRCLTTLEDRRRSINSFYFGKEIGNECDDNGSGDQQRPGHQAC